MFAVLPISAPLTQHPLLIKEASLHAVVPAPSSHPGWLLCSGVLTQMVVGKTHGHEVLGRPEVVHLVASGVGARLARLAD